MEAIFDTLLPTVLAALPGVVALGWVWFKSYAEKSEAEWDNEVVEFIEAVATEAAKKEAEKSVETPAAE